MHISTIFILINNISLKLIVKSIVLIKKVVYVLIYDINNIHKIANESISNNSSIIII